MRIHLPSIISGDRLHELRQAAEAAPPGNFVEVGVYMGGSAQHLYDVARSRFTNTDTPVWDGTMLDGVMAGYRAMSSLQLPASNLLFGDFSQVLIGEWGVLELALNPYQNFNAALFAIRAIYTCDILVRYPQAFALSTNVS